MVTSYDRREKCDRHAARIPRIASIGPAPGALAASPIQAPRSRAAGQEAVARFELHESGPQER